MIRTIVVAADESNYARIAQQHAIGLAGRIEGRLRVLAAWPQEAAQEIRDSGEDPEALARQNIQEVVDKARDNGVEAEGSYRGEAALQSLLAEAREADLVVVGMPTREQARGDDLAEALLHEGLPLFRKAESMLLVVCDPPEPLEKILVNYQPGLEGKQALRTAAWIAERTCRRLAVCCIRREASDADELSAIARRYVKAFDLEDVEMIEKTGGPENHNEILEATRSAGANFIVLGNESHNLFERLFRPPDTEEVALETRIPVLVAR
ncbi:MAG: universal stress protein [Planctomycetota bacterium]